MIFRMFINHSSPGDWKKVMHIYQMACERIDFPMQKWKGKKSFLFFLSFSVFPYLLPRMD